MIDFRNEPSIEIVDTYTKEGKHLGRVLKTQDGTVFDSEGPDPSKDVYFCTIGQWADYYAEHDGMIEIGPGCFERLQARIAALPDGHPSKTMFGV